MLILAPRPAPGQESRRQEAGRPDRTGRREPLEGLDGYIEDAMKRWEIPGLAIGVVKDDRLVYARGSASASSASRRR